MSAPAALITGAARGIGLATAHRLAGDGHRIVAVDRDADALSSAPLPPGTLRVHHDIADLTDPLAGVPGGDDLDVRVSPGYVDTYGDSVDDGERAEISRLVPLRRLGHPDDVAAAIAFLCDDDRAGYLTGADLPVDGGLDQFNWLHHRRLTKSESLDRARW